MSKVMLRFFPTREASEVSWELEPEDELVLEIEPIDEHTVDVRRMILNGVDLQTGEKAS